MILLCRRGKLNKKKPRQAPGVSSSALQEAHDIFGNVDELLRLGKQGLAKTGKYDGSGEWRERGGLKMNLNPLFFLSSI